MSYMLFRKAREKPQVGTLKPKMRLLAVLAATKELLARSVEDGWDGSMTVEALQEIDRMIEQLLLHDQRPQSEQHSLYAPTGSLQEVAMANGWSDDYMDLAAEYDRLRAIC